MRRAGALFILLASHAVLSANGTFEHDRFTPQTIPETKLLETSTENKVLKLNDSEEITRTEIQRRNVRYSEYLKEEIPPKTLSNSECENIKCAPVKERVCAKLIHTDGVNDSEKKYIHMILANQCEMDVLKCYKGLVGTVVQMKNCIKKLATPKVGKRRSKRETKAGPPIIKLIKETALTRGNNHLKHSNTNPNLHDDNNSNEKFLEPHITTLKPLDGSLEPWETINESNFRYTNLINPKPLNKMDHVKQTNSLTNIKDVKYFNDSEDKRLDNGNFKNSSVDILNLVNDTNLKHHDENDSNIKSKDKIKNVQDKYGLSNKTDVNNEPNSNASVVGQDKHKFIEIKTNDIAEDIRTDSSDNAIAGNGKAVRSRGRRYFKKHNGKPLFTHDIFVNTQKLVEVAPQIETSEEHNGEGPKIESSIEVDDNFTEINIDPNGPTKMAEAGAASHNVEQHVEGTIEIPDLNQGDDPQIKGTINIPDIELNQPPRDNEQHIEGTLEITDPSHGDNGHIEGTIIIPDAESNRDPSTQVSKAKPVGQDADVAKPETQNDSPNIEGTVEIPDPSQDGDTFIEGTVNIADSDFNGDQYLDTANAETPENGGPYIKGSIEIPDVDPNQNETAYIQGSIEIPNELDLENLNAGNTNKNLDESYIEGKLEYYDDNENAEYPINDYEDLLDNENTNQNEVQNIDTELPVVEEPVMDENLPYNDPEASDYHFVPDPTPHIIETVVEDGDIVSDKPNEHVNLDDVDKADDVAEDYEVNPADEDVEDDDVGIDDKKNVLGQDAEPSDDDNAKLEEVDQEEYNADCPTKCPSRDVMVCAKCNHGIHKTFLSVCHMRMFQCHNKDETVELVSRYPCTLTAPYISEDPQMLPKGRVTEPNDQDPILSYIRCREKGNSGYDKNCTTDDKYQLHEEVVTEAKDRY